MDALLQVGLSNALVATVLALLAAVIGRVCRRPALVHCLWLLVLIKLLTPSFLPYRIPWAHGAKATAENAIALPAQMTLSPSPRALQEPDQQADKPGEDATEIVQRSSATVASQPAEAKPPADTAVYSSAVPEGLDSVLAGPSPSALLPTLVGIWLAGSVTWFIFIAYRIYCFQRLLRCARPASAELHQQVARLAERLGLAACPALWLLPGRLSPMVWALGSRPRLLVPSTLWARLNEEQQATLLIHELAHLRRRDQWVRGLELLVTGLYWWHPVVWWACREIREAEEQCCDAWVVWALPRAARAYATALLETLDFLSETPNALPVVASGIGHVHNLRRRLTMIMHGTTPRALTGAGLLVVLGLGCFLLPLRPTWAQLEEPRDQPAVKEADEQLRVEEERGLLTRMQATREFQAQRERLQAERHMLQQEMERSRAQFEKVMHEFEARMGQLREREERAIREMEREGQAERQPAQAFSPPSPRPRSPGRERASDTESRLAELERKLDALLTEVQSLRREMRRSGTPRNPGMPTPAMTPRPGERGAPRDGEDPRPRSPRPAVAPIAVPPSAGLPPMPARPLTPATSPVAPAPAALPAIRSVPPPSPNSDPEPPLPEAPPRP